MWNIHIHTIVFNLSLSVKEEGKYEGKKERKKMNKIEICTHGFLNLIKVSETYTVDSAME